MCRTGPLAELVAVHVQHEHLISHHLTVQRIHLFPEEETYQPNVLKIFQTHTCTPNLVVSISSADGMKMYSCLSFTKASITRTEALLLPTFIPTKHVCKMFTIEQY